MTEKRKYMPKIPLKYVQVKRYKNICNRLSAPLKYFKHSPFAVTATVKIGK